MRCCFVRAGDGGQPQRIQAVVEWDWYFRESLQAIDDWEAILAEREKQLGSESLKVIYPVPLDGTPAGWLNPIPQALLPPKDRSRRVQLTVDGQRFAIARFQDGGRTGPVEAAEAGKRVQGYKHPGGGGSSQWYHRYDRRFDQLTSFVPKAAPFALEWETSQDSRLGANQFVLRLRNSAPEPLDLTLTAQLFTCARGVPSVPNAAMTLPLPKSLTLAAHGMQEIPVSYNLSGPGGGLLTLTIATSQDTYWIPLFTFLENVPAVLASIRQILDDVPDAAAQSEWSDIQKSVDACLRNGATERSGEWQNLFGRASDLRDELLLRRLDFASLLFLKRKPFYSEQPFMDAHHCYNRPGGAIYRLEPVRPDGKVTPVVDSLGAGSLS